MPSVNWNYHAWNDAHEWDAQGDEWSGMAAYCRQPYPEWKQALIDTFIVPYVSAGSDVLEIAPGHGRWTEHLLELAGHVTIVDMSPACIEACQERFADSSSISYHINDGKSLDFLDDASSDFVWSFDSFVHMEEPVIDAYLAEFARILRPGGRVVLHHANWRSWAVPLAPATRRLAMPGRVAQRLAAQGRLRDSGRRATVSARMVAESAVSHGLVVDQQVSSWGDEGQYNVDKYHDIITVASAPKV